MIERVAGKMLEEVPWPPTFPQAVNIGIAVGEVGMAMWLWSRASKGSMSLKPWQLRTAAVLSGAAALWAIYHVRTKVGTAPAHPQQLQPQQSQQVPSQWMAGYGHMRY